MKVQFSGMELDNEQRDIVNKYSDKFCKACEAMALHINIKAHKKAGGRVSYTTMVRAERLKHDMKTAEETDWDFHISVKNAFLKLEKELNAKHKGFLRRIWLRRFGD